MAVAVVLALLWPAHAAPPNPLGTDCLKTQFDALMDPARVQVTFDVKRSVSHAFDPHNPPSFLDKARDEVSRAWTTFLGRACEDTPYAHPAWAGECRVDLSEIRDKLSVFGNVYPMGGMYASGTYPDPWFLVQENITHVGYHDTGEYLDFFIAESGGSEEQKREVYEGLEVWWAFYHDVLGYSPALGDAPILPGNPQSPTWNQYVRLDGPIGPNGEHLTPQNLVYTPRVMTRQFWGYTGHAVKDYDCFGNLGLLMETQLNTAMGDSDELYDKVMLFTDLTSKALDNQPLAVEYQIHEEYHDLRKQLRSMWRTLEMFPEVLPLAWASRTTQDFPFFLWDKTAMPQAVIGGHNVQQLLFENTAASKALLSTAGWSDALIELASAMTLGGYYKIESDSADVNVGLNVKWDFVQRFGWINNKFMDFRYGPPDQMAIRKTEINNLWADLKTWLVRNNLKELMRVAVNYLPDRLCAGVTTAPTSAAPTKAPTPIPTPRPTPIPGTPTLVPTNPTLRPTVAPTVPTSRPTYPPTPEPTAYQRTDPLPSLLPIVVIDTYNVPIPNGFLRGTGETPGTVSVYEKYEPGHLNKVDRADLDGEYNNVILQERGEKQLRQRYPKRMFQFTTRDPDTLEDEERTVLRLPQAEDWYLKGIFDDGSLLREATVYELFRATGRYASRSRFVELYLVEDGAAEWDFEKHYQGVYLLLERPKRGTGRIDIKKGKEDAEVMDGGVIVCKLKPENQDFELSFAGGLALVYPKHTNATADEAIRAHLQNAEDVLFNDLSRAWQDPLLGYPAVLDVDSFVDYFLHQELIACADAYLFNVYLWHEGGGDGTKPWVIGPPWIEENSMGNVGIYTGVDGGDDDTAGWRYQARLEERRKAGLVTGFGVARDLSQWFARLLSDPVFVSKCQTRWLQLRSEAWSDELVASLLERLQSKVGGAAATRNSGRWPYSGKAGQQQEQGVEELRGWLQSRLAWIDQAITQPMWHSYTAEGTTCDVPDTRITPDWTGQSLSVVQSVSDSVSHSRSLLEECPTNCPGPWPLYPACKDRMDWLNANWQAQAPTEGHPLDATTCSHQRLINFQNPEACPAACNPGCDTGDCVGPWPEHPTCEGRIGWLSVNYQNDPAYAAIDGTTCSMQEFVYNENRTHPYCPQPCAPPTAPPTTTAPTPPTEPPLVPTSPPTQPPSVSTSNPTRMPTVPTTPPSTAPPTLRPTAEPTEVWPTPAGGVVTTPTSCLGDCYGPWPDHPLCESQIAYYMQAYLTQTDEGKALDVDGSVCSVQAYVHGESGACPAPPSVTRMQCMDKRCQDPAHPLPALDGGGATAGAATKSGMTAGGVVYLIFFLLFVIAAMTLAVVLYRRAGQGLTSYSPADEEKYLRMGAVSTK